MNSRPSFSVFFSLGQFLLDYSFPRVGTDLYATEKKSNHYFTCVNEFQVKAPNFNLGIKKLLKPAAENLPEFSQQKELFEVDIFDAEVREAIFELAELLDQIQLDLDYIIQHVADRNPERFDHDKSILLKIENIKQLLFINILKKEIPNRKRKNSDSESISQLLPLKRRRKPSETCTEFMSNYYKHFKEDNPDSSSACPENLNKEPIPILTEDFENLEEFKKMYEKIEGGSFYLWHRPADYSPHKFPNYPIKEIATILKDANSPFIFRLGLAKGKITLKEAYEIASVFKSKNSPAILQLNLFLCSIDSESFKVLMAALKNPPALEVLEIHLDGRLLDHQAISSLAEVIRSPLRPKILKIWLDYCPIEDQSVAHLTEAMKKSFAPNKIRLYLYRCSITENGWRAIADAMLTNTSITELEPIILNSSSSKFNYLIQNCCKRNQLIINYPQYENFIREQCMRLGLYKPTFLPMNDELGPKNLKYQGALFVHRNQLKTNNLPADLSEYIRNIQEIDEVLMKRQPYIQVIASK